MISSPLRAVAAALALILTQDGGWASARPDYPWSFPRDHWAHPAYRTEWWYVTGHLAADGDTTPRFGYQITFFRIGLVPHPPELNSDWAAGTLVMAHAALTDPGTGQHRFSEVLYRAIPQLGGFGAPGDSLVAWSRAPAGTDARWTLRWNGRAFDLRVADARAGFALDLSTVPERALTLQGPNGYSRKGAAPGSASQYYSFTRLATTGAVSVDGRTVQVRGRSWMDTEFGSNQLDSSQAGWDWFSLQLDDGRDVMLYLLRDSSGVVNWGGGTVVRASGAPRYLARDGFTARPTATWRSAETRAEYPARWSIEVPSEHLRLDVVPELSDQENRSRIATRLFYWEGAVRVRGPDGRPAGRGYVELTGYGRGLTPAI